MNQQTRRGTEYMSKGRKRMERKVNLFTKTKYGFQSSSVPLQTDSGANDCDETKVETQNGAK